MRTKLQRLARGLYIAAAVAVGGVSLLPALGQTALAAQVTSRNIKMSSATLSNPNTTYTVAFNTISTASPSIQAIVIDFCDTSPLVGDTVCSAPGGFSVSSPTITGQSTTAGCNISTFTVTTGGAADANTLELSAASAINVTTTPCAVSFNITTVTNPNSANHTFYARIYTYDTKAHADSHVAGGATGVVDSGGVALSTAALITVTATVQEQMTFCVTISTITGTCGGALAAPSITIGHGSPVVLTASQVDIADSSVKTQITTNAGAWVVRMKAGNSCSGTSDNGGLSSTGGTNCSIAGNGSSAATIAAGAGTWGLCVAKGSNTTLDATYNDSINSCPTSYNASSTYGMDGNSTTGTASTYGDQVLSGAAAVSNELNTFEFVATAANTTPPGVYTGNESLIATGTF